MTSPRATDGPCASWMGAEARRKASCARGRSTRCVCVMGWRQCRAGRGAAMVHAMTANVCDCCRCTRFLPTVGRGDGARKGRRVFRVHRKRASVIVLHGGLTVFESFVSGVHSQCRVPMPRAHNPTRRRRGVAGGTAER